MKRHTTKPARCNYCHGAAVVWLKWQSAYTSRGERRGITLWAAACGEHEGCVNWQSNRALHPDAEVIR